MTIDKAIEILTLVFQGKHPPKTLDEMDAVKLGVEALNRIKWNRENYAVYRISALPGETKE